MPAALALLSLLLLGLALFLARLYWLEGPAIALPEHPPSRPGIWFMSHRADDKRRFPFQHMFLRVTPRDPKWALSHPSIFSHRDAAGLAFATIGAGPVEGRLTADFNRPWDHDVTVRLEEAAGDCSMEEENRRIEALLAAVDAYKNGLRFSAWWPVSGPGYNCNSLMLGFAQAAGMQAPKFTKPLLLCPGAGRVVEISI